MPLLGEINLEISNPCKVCKYVWNILIAVDQLANTFLGGDPDETISSRAGKVQHKSRWAKALCWFLNKLDTNHCRDAIEEDEGKNQL